MKSVPNIISSKDLMYIEDMLNWNFILIKKINNYLNCVNAEKVIKVFKKAIKELNKNYNELLGILE